MNCNSVQISYASSAEVLSNHIYYPSYFRTSPSEIVLTPGLTNLVQHFGWQQVTFITEEQRLFQDVSYVILLRSCIICPQIQLPCQNVYFFTDSS